MVQCSANSKRAGQLCRRFCAPNKSVCYYHGGAPHSARSPTTDVPAGRLNRNLQRELVTDLSGPLEHPLLDFPAQIAAVLDQHIDDGPSPSDEILRMTWLLARDLACLSVAWIVGHPEYRDVFTPGPLKRPFWQSAIDRAISESPIGT